MYVCMYTGALIVASVMPTLRRTGAQLLLATPEPLRGGAWRDAVAAVPAVAAVANGRFWTHGASVAGTFHEPSANLP